MSSAAARALEQALTPWEREVLLRMRRGGGNAVLDELAGGATEHGRLYTLADVHRVVGEIRAKLARTFPTLPDPAPEVPAMPEPPEPQRGEPAIGLDPSDHVRQWIAERGTITLPQLADYFELTPARADSWVRRLMRSGDLEDTGEEEPARGGRGRPARVLRWTGEAPPTPAGEPGDDEPGGASAEALDALQEALAELADRVGTLEEDVRVLRQDGERALRFATEAREQVAALKHDVEEGVLDPLDITLQQAVAGLARIGRGEARGTIADVVRAEVSAAMADVADEVQAGAGA